MTTVSYSPSKIDQFERCQRQFWFDDLVSGRERLPTDDTFRSVGSAVHDTIMRAIRWLDSQLKHGRRVPENQVIIAMGSSLATALRQARIDASEERVQRRLEALRPGFLQVLRELPDILAGFAVDETTGERLVWAEQYLDHGGNERGVRLNAAVRSTTRADLAGLLEGEEPEPVVLDFKTGRSVIDPRFDTGVLVRARWVLKEAETPSAPWFIAGRTVRVARGGVTFAVTNFLHHESDDFRVERWLSSATIREESLRIASVAVAMSTLVASADAEDAMASPGPLCRAHCSWLHRCGEGQEHVRKYYGNDALAERLEGAISLEELETEDSNAATGHHRQSVGDHNGFFVLS